MDQSPPARLPDRGPRNQPPPSPVPDRGPLGQPPGSPGPSTDFLVPIVDSENAQFWEGTAIGELRMQSCSNCDRLRFPPRPMCPYCHSTRRSWKVMSGHATIWSFIVAHAPLPPAYAQMSPYNVIIVSLDEDPVLRMVSSLLDHPGGAVNEVNPATIQIGEPVKAVFCEQAGIWFPRFVRA